MSFRANALAYAISILAATALWAATGMISGKLEPWDSGLYWSCAYPVSIGLAAALAWAFPERSWRWALVVTLVQAPVMLVRGAGASLAPLGLALLLVLSAPPVAAALGAAGLRRRLRSP